MVRKKQTISQEYAQILHDWKERGFVDPEFDFKELTPTLHGNTYESCEELV